MFLFFTNLKNHYVQNHNKNQGEEKNKIHKPFILIIINIISLKTKQKSYFQNQMD